MLFACLLAGLVLARSGRLPDNAHASLNAVIVHISLPALTLHYLHGFSFDAGHLAPVAMPWLLFALGALVFWGIGRALRLSRPTVGALTLVGGFGNTSFVGLPMIEALYGESGLPLGLLIDQLGSYLALSTVGITVAAFYAGAQPGAALSFASVARKVFTFPPFVAMVLALALVPVKFPEPVDLALARVGDTLAPLALLSVGLQLRFGALRRRCADVSVGLAYKLLVCPALTVVVLWALDTGPGMASRVTLIESAMPPMIGAGIVAAQAGLDNELVSLLIGIGIPLAFVTVPAWNWLFKSIILAG